MTKDQMAATIRELRGRIQATQQAFAGRLGVSINSVARWETADRMPSTAMVARCVRMAEAFGFSDLASRFRSVLESDIHDGMSDTDFARATLVQTLNVLSGLREAYSLGPQDELTIRNTAQQIAIAIQRLSAGVAQDV